MGVVNYYFERATEIDDFGEYLNEVASAIVDTAPVSTCRIMLSNPSKSFLKTIALASVPEAKWKGKYQVDIPLKNLPLHKHVLTSGQAIDFDQDNTNSRMGLEELSKVLPENIQFGYILPIIIEDLPE